MKSSTQREFPEFFSLTPSQYEDMKWEILTLAKAKSGYDYWRNYYERKLRAEVARFDKKIAELTDDPLGSLNVAIKLKLATYGKVTPRFRRAVRQAYLRGHSWDINPDVYEEVASRPCCACGAPTGGGVGLDRIDNRAGYTVDNVRPMCGPCNVGRGKRVWQPAESPESVA